MKQEMLINVSQPEECRIAMVEDGVLEELYIDRTSLDSYVGNIYKGVVVNLEPSIQAAFVDFGVGKNGFLHISDVEPQYFRQGGIRPEDCYESSRSLHVGARPRIKPPIQDILRKGDEILVQVIKDGIGMKGPTLSTYISIPGRYLVLMPSLGRVGISRKIEDEAARKRLRRIMQGIHPPKGLGFIVRTAGVDRPRADLARDLSYLLTLWKFIVNRACMFPGPVTLYEESDILIRTIRDICSENISSIIIDEEGAYNRVHDFLEQVMPNYVNCLKLYDGAEPLFHRFRLDGEIRKIHQRVVPLAEGGSIVIDQAEALVAIDVNSGNFRTDDSAEETAYQMNLNAAREIARQLRLRDLGGVIVNDFIDMRKEKHRRGVERALKEAVARDRARTKILRTSPFGLIEMTRQRIRPSVKRSVFQECPYCKGTGVLKSVESMVLDVLRLLQLAGQRSDVATVELFVQSDVADVLNNEKQDRLAGIEKEENIRITVRGKNNVSPDYLDISCRNRKNEPVAFNEK
ncbi:MAG: Rne/Rng family ribonuclease [Planctomycetia bacterium]|nr:Rne/Rng family ribonuclease [Planctomycetia bacterium]